MIERFVIMFNMHSWDKPDHCSLGGPDAIADSIPAAMIYIDQVVLADALENKEKKSVVFSAPPPGGLFDDTVVMIGSEVEPNQTINSPGSIKWYIAKIKSI